MLACCQEGFQTTAAGKDSEMAAWARYLGLAAAVRPSPESEQVCRQVAREALRVFQATCAFDRAQRGVPSLAIFAGPLRDDAYRKLYQLQQRIDAVAPDITRYQWIQDLEAALAELVTSLPPQEAAALLIQALAAAPNASRNSLEGIPTATALARLVPRLPRESVLAFGPGTARDLLRLFGADVGGDIPQTTLLVALDQIARRLDERDATPLYREAARSIARGTDALGGKYHLAELASAAALLRSRLPASEYVALARKIALRIVASGEPRNRFASDSGRQPVPATLADLLAGLSPTATATQARQALELAIERLWQSSSILDDDRDLTAISTLLAQVRPEDAAPLRRAALGALWEQQARHRFFGRGRWDGYSLDLLYPVDRDDRTLAVVVTVGSLLAAPSSSWTTPVLLAAPMKPLPELPETRLLVELLGHPFCVGEGRRAVLAVLGLRYGRTFADPWEFVTFATERKFGLDFTTPAEREAFAR
jgi:hypothetical protein